MNTVQIIRISGGFSTIQGAQCVGLQPQYAPQSSRPSRWRQRHLTWAAHAGARRRNPPSIMGEWVHAIQPRHTFFFHSCWWGFSTAEQIQLELHDIGSSWRRQQAVPLCCCSMFSTATTGLETCEICSKWFEYTVGLWLAQSFLLWNFKICPFIVMVILHPRTDSAWTTRHWIIMTLAASSAGVLPQYV